MAPFLGFFSPFYMYVHIKSASSLKKIIKISCRISTNWSNCIPKTCCVTLASKADSTSIFNMYALFGWQCLDITSDSMMAVRLLCALSQWKRTLSNPQMLIDLQHSLSLPKTEATSSQLDMSWSLGRKVGFIICKRRAIASLNTASIKLVVSGFLHSTDLTTGFTHLSILSHCAVLKYKSHTLQVCLH